MDRLFRAMRNPERARGTGAMAPTSTSVDGLETVETRNYKISRAPQARHRCAGSRANRRQLRWTVAPRKPSRAKTRSVERLLRLARTSRAHSSWLVQPAEPPDADPHVRSCGRGGRVTVSPIPIWAWNFEKNNGKGISGGSWTTPQEVEDEHDQANDQQNVDKARAHVKSEKAEQPENNQN